MSLRFHYRLVRTGKPILPLGGRSVRPRPVIPITLIGPLGSSVQLAVLDPAADDTVFSDHVAAAIGLDLTQAPQGSGAGIGLASVFLRYAEVSLRLAQGQERREWKAWVGFTAAKMLYPMLGFAGFLQFFDALYPGT
jgi:hypothetical protein